jgi:hypothetical protein
MRQYRAIAGGLRYGAIMQVPRHTVRYASPLLFTHHIYAVAKDDYSAAMALLLAAQAQHETGAGTLDRQGRRRGPHCHNVGNIKAWRSWQRLRDWYTMTAPECVPAQPGDPPSPMCAAGQTAVSVGARWRAYPSLTAGVRGVVEYLHEQAETRYRHVIPLLEQGSPEYWHELGRAGYYTGSRHAYYHSCARSARLLAHSLGGETLQAYEEMRVLASWREVQTGLRDAGYYVGEIDGIVGPLTEDAIRAVQIAAQVTVDGWWGPQTRRALRAMLA